MGSTPSPMMSSSSFLFAFPISAILVWSCCRCRFVIPSISNRSMRLGFVRRHNVVMFALDIIVYSLVLGSMLVTCRKIHKLRLRFFTAPLNWVDLANQSFFLCTLVFKAVLYAETNAFISSKPGIMTPAQAFCRGFLFLGRVVLR